MAKASKKSPKKASKQTPAKAPVKASKKAAAKTAAKPKAKSVAKPAAKSSSKKAAPKATAAKTTNSKKPAAKATSAKTAAPKATPAKKSATKTSTEKKSAVTQVTDALKSVADKVTSVFSSEKPETKKKVLKSETTTKAAGKSTKGTLDLSGLFTPTDDRIVIERMGLSNRTPGGLFIPDTVADSEKPNRGRVLAVGPGHRDKKGRLRLLDVQQGDVVIFDRYAGSEVKIADQEFVLLRESEVVAIEKA